jgi:predicted acylesterase/phospholipase RssA
MPFRGPPVDCRAAERGDVPRSPLANLPGAELRDVVDGLVVSEIPASGWFANQAGPIYAVRLGPADDATEVTAAQPRQVVERIIAAGHWRDGDPDILVIFDAGYDLTRLAWLLAGLPVEVPGRLRSDRVMYFLAPPRLPGTNGRPSRHERPAVPARGRVQARRLAVTTIKDPV